MRRGEKALSPLLGKTRCERIDRGARLVRCSLCPGSSPTAYQSLRELAGRPPDRRRMLECLGLGERLAKHLGRTCGVPCASSAAPSVCRAAATYFSRR